MYRFLIILFIIPTINLIALDDDMLLYWKRINVVRHPPRSGVRRRSFIGYKAEDVVRPEVDIHMKKLNMTKTWDLQLAEPSHCEPFTTFDMECNKCYCNADGVAYCTKMACLSEKDLKKMPFGNSMRI